MQSGGIIVVVAAMEAAIEGVIKDSAATLNTGGFRPA
jgi:hypothetical protein